MGPFDGCRLRVTLWQSWWVLFKAFMCSMLIFVAGGLVGVWLRGRRG